MKTLNYFLSLCLAFTFVACKKEPSASFGSDKSFYQAGETIHLTNYSSNAESFEWIFPDGSTSTAKNPDYVLDSTITNNPIQITLKSYSKNKKKSSTVSHSIQLSEPIFRSDFFNVPYHHYVPNRKTNSISTTYKNYNVIVQSDTDPTQGEAYVMYISFNGTLRPTPGNYAISSAVNIDCSLFLNGNSFPTNSSFTSSGTYSGFVTVSSVSNNRLRLVFSNIKVRAQMWGSNNPPDFYVSADIIF